MFNNFDENENNYDLFKNENMNIDDNISLIQKSINKEEENSCDNQFLLKKRSMIKTSMGTEMSLINDEVIENLNNEKIYFIAKKKGDTFKKEIKLEISVEIRLTIICKKRKVCLSDKIIQTDKSPLDCDEDEDY